MPISLLSPIEGISAAMYTETFNLHVLLSQILHKMGDFSRIKPSGNENTSLAFKTFN